MSDIKITKERIDALLGEADIRTLTLFGKCTVGNGEAEERVRSDGRQRVR